MKGPWFLYYFQSTPMTCERGWVNQQLVQLRDLAVPLLNHFWNPWTISWQSWGRSVRKQQQVGESEKRKGREGSHREGKGHPQLPACHSRPGPSFSIPQSSFEQNTQEVLPDPCILVELWLCPVKFWVRIRGLWPGKDTGNHLSKIVLLQMRKLKPRSLRYLSKFT